VKPETPFRSGASLFCSEACATGHPNGEPSPCPPSPHLIDRLRQVEEQQLYTEFQALLLVGEGVD